ncbi:hypothetical protein L4D76_20885 [Photobacterium sagamiensis]|uniref:hypothetical protein n=1 Tax=Photobacterium sagamiensis TaxID=2910241 RepID=UPI003D149C21
MTTLIHSEDQLGLEGLGEQGDAFGPVRIALIDSAGYCYCELPLDLHMLLIAPGNTGKSAALQALKLFLLPEDSLKKAEKKFRFAHKSGYYSGEQSHSFYFPAANSMLILEVENAFGYHCQILFVGRGALRYERLFVPARLDAISPFIWNKSVGDCGCPEAQFSPTLMREQLKKTYPGTVHAQNRDQVSQLLYPERALDPETGRFALLPLKKVDHSTLNALRTMTHMMFEDTTDGKQLAKSIAALIEASKRDETDNLELDLEAIEEEHRRLESDTAYIANVEGLEDKYNLLLQQYNNLNRLHDINIRWNSLFFSARKLAQTLNENSKPLAEKVFHSNEAFEQAKQSLKQISTQAKELEITIGNNGDQVNNGKGIKGDIQLFKSRIDQVNVICARQPGTQINEVILSLEEYRQEREKRLSVLQNNVDNAHRRQELQKNKENLENKLFADNEKIEHINRLLGSHLTPHAQDVIATLIPDMMIEVLSDEELRQAIPKIEHFGELFNVDDEQISFHQQYWKKHPFSTKKQLQKNIASLERKLQDCNNQIVDIQQYQSEPANVLNKLKREVTEARNDLGLLNGIQQTRQDLHDKKEHLIEAEKQFTQAKQKIIECQSQVTKTDAAHKKHQDAQTLLLKQSDEINAIVTSLAQLQKYHEGRLYEEHALATVCSPTKELVETLENDIEQARKLRENVLNGLRVFFEQQIIHDPHRIAMSQSPSGQHVKEGMESLKLVYRELPEKKTALKHAYTEHNHLLNTKTQTLIDNVTLIEHFQRNLNQDLNETNINNLSGLKFSISLDNRFKKLVSEIQAVDFYAEQSLGESFYRSLVNFCQEFFARGESQTLTLEDIILNVDISYKIIGSERWLDKPQSNSTTSLTTLAIVQYLMQRLFKPGVKYHIPYVMDELPTIDPPQIPPVLKEAETRGFTLFCASTRAVGVDVIAAVGNHCNIGDIQADKFFSQERRIVYWGALESLGPLDDPEMQLTEDAKFDEHISHAEVIDETL